MLQDCGRRNGKSPSRKILYRIQSHEEDVDQSFTNRNDQLSGPPNQQTKKSGIFLTVYSPNDHANLY